METAGRAVLFSGVRVAIGLLALIALPIPFLRSMATAARSSHLSPRLPP